ncbi:MULTISPECIES: ATP-binding protein [Inquilinus]|uniref:histidine kinase n=1 Tax=Inquilinus ginsengisoli TaxID=363840 RepID=A0ABU1JV98_9PROT|nr:ATP-binding protein [Inquilinus ginsengisoli]MDR6292554.1 two-component system phosphate regulon sensor histidine kinase PhoR [Inquilinus ginsengisoli]
MAGPIYRHLLGIGAIAVLVIAALFLSAGAGGIGVWLAAAGVLAVVAVAGLFAWRLLRDLELLRRHIAASTVEAPETPPRPSTEIGQVLFLHLLRLQRHARGRERTLAVELQTASEILEAQEDPILVLAGDRSVLRANGAAGRLFGDRLLGRDMADAIRHPEIVAAVDAVLAGGAVQTVPLNLPVPIEREFEVRIQRFERRDTAVSPEIVPPEAAHREPGGGPEPALLVTLYDLTISKRIEQMRADFVANASHELRTPLSSLMGFIETLRGPARDDVAARERFLGIMQAQAERMSRLVNDLLSLSRIELDEHVPPTGRVTIGPLLQAVADALELKAQRKNQRLELDLSPDLPAVVGDSDQLYQVFQNLVSNAINYSRPDSVVGISARTVQEGRRPGLVVTVTDQGDGIAREHLPRLTERFYRIDPARSRAVGGTGLGLAIVKHIVSRHRGRLEIDSEVGRGSVFTVHLPAAPGAKAGGRALHKTVTELS